MPGSRRDFEVTIKLRNNQLKSRRKELGLGIVELCKLVHISPESYMALEGLKVSPVYEKEHLVGRDRTPTTKGWQKGDWRPVVLKLAAYFGCPPEELFPDTVRLVRKNTIVAEFDLAQLPQAAVAQASAMLPSPEAEYIAAETKQHLDAALGTLPPRDAEIVRLRYGLNGEEEHTLSAIADKLDLSTARVQEIERRSLTKLGNPHGEARRLLKDHAPPRALAWEEIQRLEVRASVIELHERTARGAITRYAWMCEHNSGYANDRRRLDHLAREASVARSTLEKLHGRARAAREEAKHLRKLWGFERGVEYVDVG